MQPGGLQAGFPSCQRGCRANHPGAPVARSCRRKAGRKAGPAAPSTAPRCSTAPPSGSGRSAPRCLLRLTLHGCAPRGGATAYLNITGAYLHATKMAGPAIGRFRSSPPLPAPVPTEGAGPTERGEETRRSFA